jgi:uncharacterized protein (DUF433 family)
MKAFNKLYAIIPFCINHFINLQFRKGGVRMTSPIYNERIIKIYGTDPREIPLYGLTETAKYLKLHVNTLRSWVYGRKYYVGKGRNRELIKSLPVIKLPAEDKPLLSFINLVEIHVLSAITRIHNVQFKKVRAALNYLETQSPEEQHPLATNKFWTDRFDVFVEVSGDLICASRYGQQIIQEVMQEYLHRIERDVDLTPFRLYPFTKELKFSTEKTSAKKSPKNILAKTPKNISIDPLIAFGRPTIQGTGIATNVISGRFQAGEKIIDLAKDFDIEEMQVKEAIEYEGITRNAA